MSLYIKLKKLLLVCLLTADWQQAPVEGAKLNSKLANGLCHNFESYKSSKQMSPPLKKPIQAGGGSSTNSWISWKSCEGTDNSCEPFSISTAPATAQQGKPSNPGPGGPSQGGGTPTSEYIPKVMVTMKSQSSCKRIARSAGKTRSAHIKTVVDDLKAHAKKSQAKVLEILEPKARSGDFQLSSLWISNEIVVEGSSVEAVTEMLRGSAEVKSIRLEEVWPLIQPVTGPDGDSTRQTRLNVPEPGPKSDIWDKRQMRVPLVWEAGFNGSGIRVANIDTGVYVLHPDLKDSYANDGFGWFDPLEYTETPNDRNGHGTRTMGIMVGARHNMGVAPGATWLACKSCSSHCPEDASKKCLQWILCPTSPDGGKEDCSKAPKILNCSWGRRTDLSDNPVYRVHDAAIECIRSAGIIPVFAMGNDGENFRCSAGSYPASLPNVIGVGNSGRIKIIQHVMPDYAKLTNLSIVIVNSSSPCPAHPDYNAGIKPEVMAPGSQIWAPVAPRDPDNPGDPNELYNFDAGTSFSAPNVAGTIALMLHKNPDLTYDQIKAALISSCTPVYHGVENRMCGGISETIWPNHRAGYGSIDSYDAVFNKIETTDPASDKFCERG